MPFVAEVVFQVMEYGAVVSSVPRLEPSRRNWTPETPMLSEAVAETVTEAETVEPLVGVERETTGRVVSGAGVGSVLDPVPYRYRNKYGFGVPLPP
jgi:hypothetical protein